MELEIFSVAAQVLLFAVLIVAATTDVLYKKVYNWLTYPAIVFGLTLAYCAGGVGNMNAGLESSALGFAVGAGIFGLAALTGGVGGGDWKLVGAVGAIKGFNFSFYAIWYSTVFGCLLAVVFLAYHGKILLGLRRSARRAFGLAVEKLPDGDPVMTRLPYGVAIAFGTFFAWTLAEGMWPTTRGLLRRVKAAARRLHEEQESGVAMTEFAIAFPLQFFLTLGVMQFSLVLVGHVLVQQAAFAGARAVLVADVPPDHSTSFSSSDVSNQEDTQAKRAACLILNPIAAPDASLNGGGGAAGSAIHVSADDRQNGAYALTRVTVSCRNSDNQNYVGVYVEHDFLLVIPVVNHWFAKLAGGNGGEFWYRTTGNGAYNSASRNAGLTCLTLKKSAFLPKPWKSQ